MVHHYDGKYSKIIKKNQMKTRKNKIFVHSMWRVHSKSWIALTDCYNWAHFEAITTLMCKVVESWKLIDVHR
jgi:hypothetical protein